MTLRWFSLSTPLWYMPWPWRLSPLVWKQIPIRLFTCFNRQSHELSTWGIGVLFIGPCHMFYVGDAGVRLFWIKVIRWQPEPA